MGKKILDSKALYVVLSIILTVAIWCYVTSTDGTPRNETISNVPVTFSGLDILEDRNLMIVNKELTTNIGVRATPAVLARLSRGALQANVNVSNISEAGSHTLNYTVDLPSDVSPSQVQFVSGVSGNVVTFEVARFLRREVPLKGVFQGKAADGYLAGTEDDFLFSPSTVWVSGRAELVNQVAEARVTITEEELTAPVSDEFRFELIGASGDVLELDVACDVETVYVNFPVWAMAEIPFKVNLTAGGGLDVDDVDCLLSADSIMVAGSQDEVTALIKEGAINLATIDLGSVRDGYELTFPVPLADELKNLSGLTDIRVTIIFKKQVVSQTFAATRIQYIHNPEGWNVDIVTKEVPVEIRGSQELMEELTAENIRIVADLQNITPTPGQQIVPVNVRLDSEGSNAEIGAMNSNYSIVITLTQS